MHPDRTVRNAILHHGNHYSAVLPYNLNWRIKLTPELRGYLDAHPLKVCDVGARGTPPDELLPFFPAMAYHAFDADASECERLAKLPNPFKQFKVLPYFIGKGNGRCRFNIYKEPGHSSIYDPGERYQAFFAGDGHFAVDRRVEVETVSLDAACARESLPAADFLKIDTQGSELDILRGAEQSLKAAAMVELEVEFVEVYKGQPLFHDVSQFMADRGFELLYLNRFMEHRRQVYQGPSRGQMIFGDALFGRREDTVADWSDEKIIKFALLLINYGHIDIAWQILHSRPALLTQLPSLQSYFRPQRGHRRGLIVAQLDKLAMLYLHLRGHNHLNYDSDRSWPTR